MKKTKFMLRFYSFLLENYNAFLRMAISRRALAGTILYRHFYSQPHIWLIRWESKWAQTKWLYWSGVAETSPRNWMKVNVWTWNESLCYASLSFTIIFIIFRQNINIFPVLESLFRSFFHLINILYSFIISLCYIIFEN